MIFVTMKYFVFGMFATATGRAAPVRPSTVSFMAVALTLPATHVFRSPLALSARVTAAAAMVVGTVVIVLCITINRGNGTERKHEQAKAEQFED